MRLKSNIKRLLIIIIILIIIVFIFKSISKAIYNYRVKNAKIEIEFFNTNLEVYSKVKVNDLIKSINGKVIENKLINTNKLGEKEVNFTFINNDNLKIPYKFKVNIVDSTPPLISKANNFSIFVGDKDFSKRIFCGDNYDDKPRCIVNGEYDINRVGQYNIEFVGIDNSGNKSVQNMTLNVKEKKFIDRSYKSRNFVFRNYIEYKDIVEKYKNKNTKIGIDVSHWQGNINFDKLKEVGVEFAIIRVGTQKGINGEYILDKKFKDNIEGFNKVKIPVGVYFFSYANSREEALKQAKWVVKEIHKYDIDYPVVFDWENWNHYQDFNLSFNSLTRVSSVFLNEIKKHGYKTMLYSSKNFLETVWKDNGHDIWLAHYTNGINESNYTGKYKMWQVTEHGKVDGVSNNTVDINVWYERK